MLSVIQHIYHTAISDAPTVSQPTEPFTEPFTEPSASPAVVPSEPSLSPGEAPQYAPYPFWETYYCAVQSNPVTTLSMVDQDKYYGCIPTDVDVGKCFNKEECYDPPGENYWCQIESIFEKTVKCRNKQTGQTEDVKVNAIKKCTCQKGF